MREDNYKYNPWPLGQLPIELQRSEPMMIKSMGYDWKDPRDIVDMFEEKVAKFAGSKYAVATDSCTHALELCFRYLIEKNEVVKAVTTIYIPDQTYVSVALMLMRLGINLNIKDERWSGIYKIKGSRVIDGAVRWSENMYIIGSLQCLSFQIKKRIPIGRGGMILCDSKEEYDWFKLAVYDGRDLKTAYDSNEHVKMLGYHYYMTPEDAARGIILMDHVKEQGDTGNYSMYPSILKMLEKFIK